MRVYMVTGVSVRTDFIANCACVATTSSFGHRNDAYVTMVLFCFRHSKERMLLSTTYGN